MIKKVLPILLLIGGFGAGVAASIALSPLAEPQAQKSQTKDDKATAKAETDKQKKENVKVSSDTEGEKKEQHEYLKLPKQFVVPVVEQDRIAALVTMSLSLETRAGVSEEIYAIEPNLRDGFLQVLFDHANVGGFDGNFTHSDNLQLLRRTLLEEAQKHLGTDVSRVLIMSVSRQDT